MTTFTQGSPGAVRCVDCQHCPASNRGFLCTSTGQHTIGRGHWRRCDRYQPGPPAQPVKPGRRVQCSDCKHRPMDRRNPCEPAGVYMTIIGFDKRRLCDHWLPRYKIEKRRPLPPQPEVRFVAKEHVEAALAANPGASVVQFRPKGEA